MTAWQIFGTIAFPVISVCIAIYFTNRIAIKTTRELSKITNEMIDEARRHGVKRIEQDLKDLGESTVKVIEADGKETRNAIEATIKAIQVDGQQMREATREAIEDTIRVIQVDGQQTREAIKAMVKKQ